MLCQNFIWQMGATDFIFKFEQCQHITVNGTTQNNNNKEKNFYLKILLVLWVICLAPSPTWNEGCEVYGQQVREMFLGPLRSFYMAKGKNTVRLKQQLIFVRFLWNPQWYITAEWSHYCKLDGKQVAYKTSEDMEQHYHDCGVMFIHHWWQELQCLYRPFVVFTNSKPNLKQQPHRPTAPLTWGSAELMIYVCGFITIRTKKSFALLLIQN